MTAIDREKLQADIAAQLLRDGDTHTEGCFVIDLIDAAPALPAGLPDVEVGAAVMHATLRSLSVHTGSDEVCDECRTDTAEFLAALEGSATLPSDRCLHRDLAGNPAHVPGCPEAATLPSDPDLGSSQEFIDRLKGRTNE